jgi:hypothetical protein
MEDLEINMLLAKGWDQGERQLKPFTPSEWSYSQVQWYLVGWKAAEVAKAIDDRRHPDYQDASRTQPHALWPSVPGEGYPRPRTLKGGF